MTTEKWAIVRKTLYALVPAVGTILIATGHVSQESWEVIAGVIVQVITLFVAFFNTSPTDQADLEHLRETVAPKLKSAEQQLKVLREQQQAQAEEGERDDVHPIVGGQGDPVKPSTPLVNPQGALEYEPRHS